MAEFDCENIIEQIRDLEIERAEILTHPLSPEGAWIHHYTKKRVYPSGFVGWYQYAKWQANEPIFDRKNKQHKKRLEAIDRALSTISKMLSAVEKAPAPELPLPPEVPIHEADSLQRALRGEQ